MDNEALIKTAYKAMETAYAPYSNFKVGAAVLTECGKVFVGCNIENLSFGATICAERCAIFSAIAQGYRKFTKIAIVSSQSNLTFPCGICRQVMAEFMPDGEVILTDGTDIDTYRVSELIPYSFDNKF